MNAAFARVACVLLPILITACGGADASQLMDRRNVGGPADATEAAPDGGGTGNDPAVDPSASSSGGPTTGAADGGADGGSSGSNNTPAVNAFTGAAAFVAKNGPSARKDDHNFAGNNPPTNPRGQACSNCHDFFMGGTVFADVAGTTPAAGVEVRVRDAAGNAKSAWTDQDGNFYIENAGAVTLPAMVGVRNTATARPMSASVANGTCASSACHVTGKQGPIHLP